MTKEVLEVRLTEAQIDEIAEKAAHRALDMVYADIGKSIVRKVLWVLGLAAASLWFWLSSTGKAPHINPAEASK